MEVVEKSDKIDLIWMNPRERLEHDVARAMVPTKDETSAAILALPFETRVEILRSIETLSPRKQQLVRFAIYQTAHECVGDSQIPFLYRPGSYAAIQAEYREIFPNRSILVIEAHQIQVLYRDNIAVRLRRPK